MLNWKLWRSKTWRRILRYYTGIYLQAWRKPADNISQDNKPANRDWNQYLPNKGLKRYQYIKLLCPSSWKQPYRRSVSIHIVIPSMSQWKGLSQQPTTQPVNEPANKYSVNRSFRKPIDVSGHSALLSSVQMFAVRVRSVRWNYMCGASLLFEQSDASDTDVPHVLSVCWRQHAHNSCTCSSSVKLKIHPLYCIRNYFQRLIRFYDPQSSHNCTITMLINGNVNRQAKRDKNASCANVKDRMRPTHLLFNSVLISSPLHTLEYSRKWGPLDKMIVLESLYQLS
jgi:hypothetical protein